MTVLSRLGVGWAGAAPASPHRCLTAPPPPPPPLLYTPAPAGGLLFCIEEGVSFYSTSIFWRGFLATSVGVLTLHILVDAKDHPGRLLATKFGRFRDFGGRRPPLLPQTLLLPRNLTPLKAPVRRQMRCHPSIISA